jgi:hypothetical protein
MQVSYFYKILEIYTFNAHIMLYTTTSINTECFEKCMQMFTTYASVITR